MRFPEIPGRERSREIPRETATFRSPALMVMLCHARCAFASGKNAVTMKDFKSVSSLRAGVEHSRVSSGVHV